MEPLSYSIISTLLRCPRQCYWQFEKLYAPRPSENLVLGRAFHKGVEEEDPQAGVEILHESTEIWDQSDQDELMKKSAWIEGMVEGALTHWRHDWYDKVPEQEFELPIVNPETGAKSRTFYLTGKIDELVYESPDICYLTEYKSSGSGFNEDTVHRVETDLQLSVYFHAAEVLHDALPQGILFRMVRKPSIRQKKSETVREYCDRVRQDYQERPDFYFHEEAVARSRDHIRRLRKELWDITQLYLFYRRNDIWPKNTLYCSHWGRLCDYAPLCREEEDADLLYELMNTRTPELSDI